VRVLIDLGGETVAADVAFSRRRSVALHLYADGTVSIRAPRGCPRDEILRFVDQKRSWMRRKRQWLRQQARPPLVYLEGGIHRFLGQAHALRIERGRPQAVGLAPDAIVVRLGCAATPEAIRRALDRWYREQALALLPALFQECLAAPEFAGLQRPQLRLRRMKSRWGSCSRDGRVQLNTLLMAQPPAAIRYVIVHELCHLVEFNHGPAFYRLLTDVMPGWKSAAALLEG
jgi:predicted metal-dependent hydrolase